MGGFSANCRHTNALEGELETSVRQFLGRPPPEAVIRTGEQEAGNSEMGKVRRAMFWKGCEPRAAALLSGFCISSGLVSRLDREE